MLATSTPLPASNYNLPHLPVMSTGSSNGSTYQQLPIADHVLLCLTLRLKQKELKSGKGFTQADVNHIACIKKILT